MSAEYYAGKWNDHDIVLVTNAATDGKVQLRFDGEVIADGTTIFHMDKGITGKVPIVSSIINCTNSRHQNCTVSRQ